MLRFVKIFCITFLFLQLGVSARYYSSEMGRFINRDPIANPQDPRQIMVENSRRYQGTMNRGFIQRDAERRYKPQTGYHDGMSLYNAYFAEEFMLDPSGTESTTHDRVNDALDVVDTAVRGNRSSGGGALGSSLSALSSAYTNTSNARFYIFDEETERHFNPQLSINTLGDCYSKEHLGVRGSVIYHKYKEAKSSVEYGHYVHYRIRGVINFGSLPLRKTVTIDIYYTRTHNQYLCACIDGNIGWFRYKKSERDWIATTYKLYYKRDVQR